MIVYLSRLAAANARFPRPCAVCTLGRPPIAAALTSASRIRLAIIKCSSCFDVSQVDDGAFSMACWKTFGISSGRFRKDRVTPVIKYHVFDGRCGYVLKVCKRVGVMMDGSIAEEIVRKVLASYLRTAQRVCDCCTW